MLRFYVKCVLISRGHDTCKQHSISCKQHTCSISYKQHTCSISYKQHTCSISYKQHTCNISSNDIRCLDDWTVIDPCRFTRLMTYVYITYSQWYMTINQPSNYTVGCLKLHLAIYSNNNNEEDDAILSEHKIKCLLVFRSSYFTACRTVMHSKYSGTPLNRT